MEETIYEESTDEARQGIDKVVGVDIHRGGTEQQVERQEQQCQPLEAVAEGKDEQQGGNADVAAGEGGGGAFAGLVGYADQLVEGYNRGTKLL